MSHDDLVQDTLISVFQLASEEALISTLEALAAASGVTHLQGHSLREYFETVKLSHAEHLVAEWADDNPSFASEMKRAWDSMHPESGDSPPQ